MRKLDFLFHALLIFLLLAVLLMDWKAGLYFVLIAQFFVGIFQVLSSAIRTFRLSAFDPTIKKLIVFYWILCGAYALGLSGFYFVDFGQEYINTFFFSAWGIAFYYCYITYLLAFPNYVKSHLDI